MKEDFFNCVELYRVYYLTSEDTQEETTVNRAGLVSLLNRGFCISDVERVRPYEFFTKGA